MRIWKTIKHVERCEKNTSTIKKAKMQHIFALELESGGKTNNILLLTK